MTESQMQMQVVMDYLYPLQKIKEFEFFHIPNEAALANSGNRSQIHRMRISSALKKMGLKTGIPDLCFLMNGGKVFFIEMKSEKGVLNKNQKFRIPILEGLGFPVHICRDLKGVKEALRTECLI